MIRSIEPIMSFFSAPESFLYLSHRSYALLLLAGIQNKTFVSSLVEATLEEVHVMKRVPLLM